MEYLNRFLLIICILFSFTLVACSDDESSDGTESSDDSGSSTEDDGSVTLSGSGTVAFTASGLTYSDDTVTLVVFLDGVGSQRSFGDEGLSVDFDESFSGYIYQSPYHSCSVGNGSESGDTTTFPISCNEVCDPTEIGFGGGDGSSSDPFTVCSDDQLSNLDGYSFSGFYNNVKQYADIDLEGSGFTAIASFSGGNYDGNNYSISNLTLNSSSTNGAGLFLATSEVVIGRMKLENVDITGYAPSGDGDIGGLIGFADDTIVAYSSVTGSVKSAVGSGSGEAVTVGGVIGYSQSSDFLALSFDGNIDALARASSNDQYVGGLVGYLSQSDISGSFTHGDIDGGYDHVGGLVGESYGGNLVTNFTTADVDGRDQVGGLIGSTDGDHTSHGTLVDEAIMDNSVTCLSGTNCGAYIGFVDTASQASGNVTGIFNWFDTSPLNAAGNVSLSTARVEEIAGIGDQMIAATGTDYDTGLTDIDDDEIIIFTSDTWIDLNGDDDLNDDWETDDAAGVFTYCSGELPSFALYCD